MRPICTAIETKNLDGQINWLSVKFNSTELEHAFQLEVAKSSQARGHLRCSSIFFLIYSTISIFSGRSYETGATEWACCIAALASLEALRMSHYTQCPVLLRNRIFYVFALIFLCIEISFSLSALRDQRYMNDTYEKLTLCDSQNFTVPLSGITMMNPIVALTCVMRSFMGVTTCLAMCLTVTFVHFPQSALICVCSGVLSLANMFFITGGFSNSVPAVIYTMLISLFAFAMIMTFIYMHAGELRRCYFYRQVAESELQAIKEVSELKIALAQKDAIYAAQNDTISCKP